jgi:hypothetical protein
LVSLLITLYDSTWLFINFFGEVPPFPFILLKKHRMN